MSREALEHAMSLHRAARLAEAENAYRQILAAYPTHAGVMQLIGVVAHQTARHGEAIEWFHRSLVIEPALKLTWNNLGEALRATGQIDESIAAFRRALQLDPNYAKAHSNLLLTLHFDPDSTGESMREEHEAWARRHARGNPTAHREIDRSPDRVLNIGYVSPDFRRHSVAYFIEPIIRNHDRAKVRVYCFSNRRDGDDVSERIRAAADGWHDISGLNDEQAAELIRRLRIDILVDLTGHMANNRLMLFARKPAPIQATYLGYPNGTGLRQIDYRITDALADPPGMTESHVVEQLARVSHCAWCYEPPAPATPIRMPGVDRLITFGSFNKFAKVSSNVVQVWSQVLLAVPASRLLLKNKSMGDESIRRRAMQLFAREGIDPSRLELIGWVEGVDDHLSAYNDIDIALDTFPYAGTTTTCEALWMGVGVVTLAGSTHVSRVGASLLSAVGLPELIVKTAEQYVQMAVDLAADAQRRLQLRQSLRQKMQESPLMDSHQLAGSLEDLYRTWWAELLQKQS